MTPRLVGVARIAVVLVLSGGIASAALVGHWTFDNTLANSKPSAMSPNGDGTNSGTVFSNECRVGTASLLFDNLGDYVNIGTIPVGHPLQLASGTNGQTYAFWMRTTASAQFTRVLDKSTGSAGVNGYTIWLNDGTDERDIHYRVNNGLNAVTVNGVWNSDEWTHVVVKASGVEGTTKFFVNGVQVSDPIDGHAGGTTVSPPDVQAPMRFGDSGAGNAGADFIGYLDDLGLWDQELTTGEAVALYNLGESALDYSQSDAEQLFNVHAEDLASAIIDGLIWTRATGLAGADGELSGSGDNWTLVLDAGNGTGVVSAAAPGAAGTVVTVR